MAQNSDVMLIQMLNSKCNRKPKGCSILMLGVLPTDKVCGSNKKFTSYMNIQ